MLTGSKRHRVASHTKEIVMTTFTTTQPDVRAARHDVKWFRGPQAGTRSGAPEAGQRGRAPMAGYTALFSE